MDDINKSKNAVYSLSYHICFVTKYRRKVLTDAMTKDLQGLGTRLLAQNNGELVELNTDKDHVHMLVSLPPTMAPCSIINVVKTQFSKMLHKKYGWEISKRIHGDALWSPSYFVSTTGGANLEKVKAYIESQQTEEHQQKYAKRAQYKRNGGRIHPPPS